ncbi:MAG: hypothetical protein M3380_06990 [Chloroflexota bacterium]|nr:hypothetical protein [Chloroflexota bacterium]
MRSAPDGCRAPAFPIFWFILSTCCPFETGDGRPYFGLSPGPTTMLPAISHEVGAGNRTSVPDLFADQEDT